MKQLVALSTALLAPLCLAGEPPDLSGDEAKINYSVGYQIGGDFKLQGVEMQTETVIRGIQDALSGAEPLLTKEEMRTTMGELGKRITDQRNREKHLAKTRIEKENVEFLVANAKKEGVITTPSGLQYKVIEPGTGRTPKATDTVTVNYRGTLIDGKEFDSSYKRRKPASFRVDGVIAGWTEALQLMKEGAKWQLFIPHRLAYGEKGQLREKTLIFDVELLSIGEPEATAAAEPGAAPAE
ncbi:MAG: FKBP-type peptidyl-prolyl cis-trans isomerase [Thiogranum sp.]